MQPIGRLLTLQARRDPDRPAFTFQGKTTTRAQLEAGANRWARSLQASGVRQGDFVALALPNGLAAHEVTFAVWKLGAVPSPVSPKLPDAELRAILEILQPRLVIGMPKQRNLGFAALDPGFEPNPELSADALPDSISEYWKATTSGGSTGRPKIIVDNRPGTFDWQRPFVGMVPDDVVLNTGQLYHTAPFANSNNALMCGAHVIEMARFEAEETLELIDRHKVGWVSLVPTMMKRIWDLPEKVRAKYDLSSLQMVIHMASPCPIWLKERWISWLGADRIFEVYAGSEGIGSASITGHEWLEHKGSVGRVQPTAELKVINEAGQMCKPGEVGELYFLPKNGRGSTYRYLGSDPKNHDDFESYGDMGWVDEDGYLYLADRRTDLILSGGANVYPAEIEAALDAHPRVRSSIVIGLPDEDMGQVVHAIIEIAGDADALLEQSILAHLAQRLVKYKLPRSLEFVSHSLRDDGGKARRSALRQERIERLSREDTGWKRSAGDR